MNRVSVDLHAVIVAVTDEIPRVLVLNGEGEPPSLPVGPLEPHTHRTLELGLRAWVRRQTGIELGYVEQLYTFGDRDRQVPGQDAPGRVLSIAYLALVKEATVEKRQEIIWLPVYDFLPWEDWRDGKPAFLDRDVIPALQHRVQPTAGNPAATIKEERLATTFGQQGAPWSGELVLERYELLYQAGLVSEAARDSNMPTALPVELGRPLISDHRRILATALGRLRGKIRYRPVVFELMPPTFTLLQLQRCVEALAGVHLHKQNFRRLVVKGGLVEETDWIERNTGGRPAKLFRFRQEVLRERSSPGVGLPGKATAASS